MATAMSQYRVQPGESPAAIARKHGVSVAALMNANQHKPLTSVAGKHTWQSLRHGETLNVPHAARMLGDGEQMASVISTKLNIRSAPSTSGSIMGGNSQGDFVSVLDWNAGPPDSAAPSGWAKVNSPMGLYMDGTPGRSAGDPVVGYVSKQFLNLQPALAPMPITSAAPSGLPGLPIPAGWAPPVSIPGLPPGTPLPPPAAPSPGIAGQMLAAMLKSGGCAGCGDTSSPLSQATGVFKKASLSDPNCVGMACPNIYGSTYNTQGAAMYAYGPGTQTALSKAIGSSAPPACTDSYGKCLGGPTPVPAPLPVFPIPVSPAVYPTPAPSSGGQVATVTASKLNIRSAPSVSGAVVGGVSQNDRVNVLNWNGAPSDSNAPMGWAQVSSPSGLNVDGSPGRSSAVTGYMSKQYLSLSAAPAPAPTPAPQVATTCPPGQIYIPILGCQPIPGLPAGPSQPPAPLPVPVLPAKLDTTCPPGQTYMPIVGCVPTPALPPLPPPTPGPSTPIGPGPTPTILSCPAGQIMNPLTGKCSPIPTLPLPIPVLPSPAPSPPAPAPTPGGPIQPTPGAVPAKAGLSTGTLIAAGLGVAALVGVVAYAATRKKTGHAGKRGKTGHKGKSAHKKAKRK